MRFIRIPVGVLVIFSIDLPSLTAGVLSVQPEHSFLSSDREHSIQVDHTRQTTTTILQPSPNNPAGRPENGFRIMYRWQAAPMDRDYTVFVHFVDKNGKTVFQDDHEPPTPTSKWNGFKQQYGYFECRAKFPKGPGTWPAFWLMGLSAEQLIRYALTLPVAGAVIGMPNLEIIESNATIARTLKPMPDRERRKMSEKLSVAAADGTLFYTAAGYCDGTWA